MDGDKDKAQHERPEDLLAAREEFLQVFKRGAQFTEELLKENERLRFRVAELELRTGRGNDDDGLIKELVEKVRRLEEERESLVERFAEVEAENRDFANRYVEVEAENNKLLNLYIASYQLHSTLNFDEVLQIITEIILNFVGAEVFAVAVVDEDKGSLRPLIHEGVDPQAVAALSVRQGRAADVLRSREAYFAPSIEARDVVVEQPLACIPLSINERVLGVVLLYRFLQQKTHLGTVDHELLTLLAGHAATAIFASKLYTDSTRKLKTIQGLIDLVTS